MKTYQQYYENTVLERLCRVVEWACFGVWVTALYSIIMSYLMIRVFVPVYFNLNNEFIFFLVLVSYTLIYIVRGKVRFLPWR